MSKIKIKNFGPIKEGYLENDGWMDVKKVTVFIGNQGSGKSTVAKLISSFMWLEKALIRGDIKETVTGSDFEELTEFHRLQNYVESNSEIEYEGDKLKLTLVRNGNSHSVKYVTLNTNLIRLPKIMYVPAERNFLSSIENISTVSNLIVGSLRNYSIEFRNAQLTNNGKEIDLPINNTKVVYDPKDDENYIVLDNGKRLKLAHASSGFHSIVPLHWVTKYLIDFLNQDEKKLLLSLSPDQAVRRKNQLNNLNSLGLDEKEIKDREKTINNQYICKYFVNIVEEPEQNLFPTSQRDMLNSLLSYNNLTKENKLIMTTHSPYLLVYLTLSVEAHKLKEKVNTEELRSQLNDIVPLQSTVDGNDLVVYQLNEINGTIEKLEDYKGLPSDKNKLNDGLIEANDDFSKLLDLEDLCQ